MKIYLRGQCNNDCLFCELKNRKEISFSQVKKKISGFNHKKDKRIIFTGTEPTLRKDLFDLLKSAKAKKINIIQLTTNGRLLADKEFAKRIISSGANYFKISLHGDDAQLHDRIVQRKGSFRQTIKGIENLIELNQRDNIVLSVVLLNLNYRHLPEILKIAKRFKIKKVQLNAARTNNHNLLVPLDILANYISRVRYQFFFDLLIKTKDIPYCLLMEPESFFFKKQKKRKI
jgi:MoaA/NifB/PqqE/SkfB family radical SAM enzyme